jgi:hypothetical protein
MDLELVTYLRNCTTVTSSAQTTGESKEVGCTFKICAIDYGETDVTGS